MLTNQLPISKDIIKLWYHLSFRRRRQFGLLLLMMLFVSFAEILSLGAVLPFIGVLTTPERVFSNETIQPIIRVLGLRYPSQLLLPLTIAFGSTVVFAGAVRLLFLWASTRFSFATGADLSFNIYRRTLHQKYAVHCARNSSQVIDGVSGKTNIVIYQTIAPILTLVSSLIVLFITLLALLSIEPMFAVLAFGGFGSIYIIIIRITRRRLILDGQRISNESSRLIKIIQEGLGGIRDVLIDGSQSVYCQIYRNSDLKLRRAQGNSLFISSSPRYCMEAFGMLLISVIAYFLSIRVDGIGSAIPILGSLALGAQRILPILQQAYSAWSTIQGAQSALRDTIELLDQPLPEYSNLISNNSFTFRRMITLKNVDFQYSPLAPFVVKGVNFTIAKGDRIGFIGTTGSGKSTLLDIIMALLEPTNGYLEVDGQIINSASCRAWQSHLAHVPQSIFLADSSIEENIAFGVEKSKIDQQRVFQAAEMAQIARYIETLPNQYQTFVGERGIRLSGGQRQRIGIARALYKKADVIIFDEATSALDTTTEQSVMRAIDSLSNQLTILIIAHRVTTLKGCSKIVELDRGEVKRVHSYSV